jgi:EAL domain-containing protein (putative c-di-GMP-specific phosphodiesterase class I)
VLDKACRQLGLWAQLEPEGRSLTMHVNVSGLQLVQHDFPTRVQRAIVAAKVEPAQLIIELTESVLIEKLEVARPHLESLRELGVQVSIDDFGTGYSSFIMLHELPINVIKIDRSFIARLGADDNGQEVVRAILTLGRTLDKTMIAEGIETEAQLQRLIEMRCEKGQGFLLGRPVRADEAALIIRAGVGGQSTDGQEVQRHDALAGEA